MDNLMNVTQMITLNRLNYQSWRAKMEDLLYVKVLQAGVHGEQARGYGVEQMENLALLDLWVHSDVGWGERAESH